MTTLNDEHLLIAVSCFTPELTKDIKRLRSFVRCFQSNTGKLPATVKEIADHWCDMSNDLVSLDPPMTVMEVNAMGHWLRELEQHSDAGALLAKVLSDINPTDEQLAKEEEEVVPRLREYVANMSPEDRAIWEGMWKKILSHPAVAERMEQCLDMNPIERRRAIKELTDRIVLEVED